MSVEQIRNIIAGGERTSRNVLLQSSAGVLVDVDTVHRFGITDSLQGNDQWQTIWPEAHRYPRILAAGKLSIVSSSVSDSHPSGIGAQIVHLTGSDANGDELKDVVLMNGVTPVETNHDFVWLTHAQVIQMGEPYGTTQGVITITHQGTVKEPDIPIVGTIRNPYNRTTQAVCYIPRDYSGYLVAHSFTIASQMEAQYGWMSWSVNDVVTLVFPEFAVGGPHSQSNSSPERVPFPAFFQMVVKPSLAANSKCSGNFSMMRVHKRYDSIPGALLQEEQFNGLFEP